MIFKFLYLCLYNLVGGPFGGTIRCLQRGLVGVRRRGGGGSPCCNFLGSPWSDARDRRWLWWIPITLMVDVAMLPLSIPIYVHALWAGHRIGDRLRELRPDPSPTKVLAKASTATLVQALSDRPGPATAEVSRRLSGGEPDWELLERLIGSSRTRVRDLGLHWLGETAPAWIHNPQQTLDLLTLHTTAWAVALRALPTAEAQARTELAVRLLAALDTQMVCCDEEGANPRERDLRYWEVLDDIESPTCRHQRVGKVVIGELLAEVGESLTPTQAVALVDAHTAPLRAVGRALLTRLPREHIAEVTDDPGLQRLADWDGYHAPQFFSGR